jgi:hypothetical protein
MLERATPLQAVSAQDLPEYPIARDERLPELAFVKWVPSRWLQSSGHLKCTYEVQGMARALFDLATAQSPIGTLPDDTEELSILLRVPMPHFAALRALGPRGPLRNWVRCTSAGEVRLMHPVVMAMLEDVLHRRQTRELSREAQAEAKRLERLSKGLKAAGLSDAVLGDAILLARLDEWLSANWKGNRTPLAYLRVVEAAAKAKWI